MTCLYARPAGISLLVHTCLLGVVALITGGSAAVPRMPDPPPIEVTFEASRLIDMGSGKLHFTSGAPLPGPRAAGKAARGKAAKAVPGPPKPVPSPPPATPASVAETLSPALPDEPTDATVALPMPGDSKTDGGGSVGGHLSGSGTGGAGGGAGPGGGGGVGEGESGGGYSGAGFLYGTLPGYPQSARRAGREGVVTVRVLVGTDGAAVSVTVRVTSGHEDFDNAAVQAIRKWRFSPARRGGTPVASFHDIRVRFRLEDAK